MAYIRRGYIWWEICVTKPIGLAYSSKLNLKRYVYVSFLPCFILYFRAISKYKPPGDYIRRGDLTEGFLRYDFGAACIWRGLYMEELIFGILRYIQRSIFWFVVIFLVGLGLGFSG